MRPKTPNRALYEALEDRRMFSSVVVNSILDQSDPTSSSIVTLRDAISRANAATSSTSITFDPTVFSSLKTIKLNGSRLVIQTAVPANVVSITGPTAGVIINGNNASGDFVIWSNTKATLANLRIVGGKSTNGAGVDNYGTVSVINSTITENSSPNGGGVYTDGAASFLNDTISNNIGTTGGGIWNGNGGYLSLTDTTVSGNTASYGGGIYNGGTLNGTTELHNATISNNTAGFGGGVYNYTGGTVGTVGLSNTVIAQNHRTGTGLSGNDVAGTFASKGYNLIGNVDGSTGWVSSDLTGTSTVPLNAELNPLGNYGGPTYTMTLAPGSPGIGAGSPALMNWEKYDQRGLTRIVDGRVDIGATETQTPVTVLPTPEVIGPGSTASPGPVLTTLTPTFSWHGITAGITGYQLNLYDKTSSKEVSYTFGVSVTSFNLPAGVLTAGDQYVWNLRVLNGTASGPPSVYLNFQAPPATVALPAPTVLGPGSTESPGPVLTTLTPTFSWKPITTGITGYQLNLYDTTASKGVSYTFGVSVTSFNLPAGVLVAGDKYVWNLRVLNGTASGPPSVYLYFQAPPATVTLPAPTVLGPGSTESPGPVLTTLTPTFSWKPITTGITGYQLNLYDTTASKGVSYTFGVSVTSFNLPAGVLVAGDKYVWNLRVLNGTASGPPSAYLYFQAPPAVVLPKPIVIGPGSTTSPGPVLDTTTPTFTWDAVSGNAAIDGYQLNLYDITTSKFVSYQIPATATRFTPGALTAGDSYVWNLRVVVGTTTGPESAYLYFQIAPAV